MHSLDHERLPERGGRPATIVRPLTLCYLSVQIPFFGDVVYFPKSVSFPAFPARFLGLFDALTKTLDAFQPRYYDFLRTTTHDKFVVLLFEYRLAARAHELE